MENTTNNATVNATIGNAIKLFKKVEVNAPADYNGLITFLTGLDLGFKKSVTLDDKCNTVLRIQRNGGDLTRKHDYMIAYRGNTHSGSLVSIWSSYGRKETKKAPARPADFGIRISKPYLDTLAEKSPAIALLFSNFKYEDSNEYRGSFYNFNDVLQFFVTFSDYISATENKTKTVENEANAVC